jgi:hypothetical protein
LPSGSIWIGGCLLVGRIDTKAMLLARIPSW